MIPHSLEHRLSVLDFVLQLCRKIIQNGKPGFEASLIQFLVLCKVLAEFHTGFLWGGWGSQCAPTSLVPRLWVGGERESLGTSVPPTFCVKP